MHVGHSNRRPDEEGIKTHPAASFRQNLDSNRRPDEEGIKTDLADSGDMTGLIPTADLMKKGLRRSSRAWSASRAYSNRRPDEEGIKTAPNVAPPAELHSNRRPDEEGIKTHHAIRLTPLPLFQPQT